jgi:tRNA pseudouridine55 synthase
VSESSTAGLLVIDKPAGMTSHDVVERVRDLLHERVGHAGTLDPQATGVLLLCVGAATRLSRFLQGHDKIYEGVVRLGWATDTYDAQGEPAADPVPVPSLHEEAVRAALGRFMGEQQQVPPVYSAKKVRGQPAYRRARRGEPVQPDPVTVTVYALELLQLAGEQIHLRVHCSAGTYVRTLAHDLGAALGCPAHLAALRRTASGAFDLRDALEWQVVEDGEAAALRARVLHGGRQRGHGGGRLDRAASSRCAAARPGARHGAGRVGAPARRRRTADRCRRDGARRPGAAACRAAVMAPRAGADSPGPDLSSEPRLHASKSGPGRHRRGLHDPGPVVPCSPSSGGSVRFAHPRNSFLISPFRPR